MTHAVGKLPEDGLPLEEALELMLKGAKQQLGLPADLEITSFVVTGTNPSGGLSVTVNLSDGSEAYVETCPPGSSPDRSKLQ